MNLVSLISLMVMVGGILGLFLTRSLFSINPAVIAVQTGAFVLMVWARMTFGRRSFHASANPTDGGLVTNGPYAFVRHPIYTAVFVFVLAGAMAHLSSSSLGLVLVVLLGAVGRMVPEEQHLLRRYPEYAAYAARTKRMVPFVF